jgi:hypothetical protein
MPQKQSTNETEELQESEVVDFTKPDFVFTPGRHTWRQRGPYLCCAACALGHAAYIGMHKQMVGEEKDGTPILKIV